MNGATVKCYSRAKDGLKQVSPHFKVREFACSDGSDPVFIAPALVDVLEKIREHFRKPVHIISGFRSVTKNKSVGGAQFSQHLFGTASDIVVGDEKTGIVAPKTVAAYAETLLKNTGGIGIYKTFTHIDVRTVKSRWNG